MGPAQQQRNLTDSGAISATANFKPKVIELL